MKHQTLLNELEACHRKACHRPNSSTQVLIAAYQSNGGDIAKSISAAMMCLGGLHAPIKQAYMVIQDFKQNPHSCYYVRWWGFGSSFVKNRTDPLFDDINNIIYHSYEPSLQLKREMIQHVNKDRERRIYPNLAFYTALVAHITETPIRFCECRMIEWRVSEWIKILQEIPK